MVIIRSLLVLLCAASAAYNTLDVLRHLISRRTLRAARAEAAAQGRAAAAVQRGFGRGKLSRFLGPVTEPSEDAAECLSSSAWSGRA